MSGTPFVGQTEHLARASGLADDEVSMLFLGPRLKVSLVTTHLALRDVPAAITEPRVRRACLHLGEALVALGVLPSPHAPRDRLAERDRRDGFAPPPLW